MVNSLHTSHTAYFYVLYDNYTGTISPWPPQEPSTPTEKDTPHPSYRIPPTEALSPKAAQLWPAFCMASAWHSYLSTGLWPEVGGAFAQLSSELTFGLWLLASCLLKLPDGLWLLVICLLNLSDRLWLLVNCPLNLSDRLWLLVIWHLNLSDRLLLLVICPLNLSDRLWIPVICHLIWQTDFWISVP